MQHRRGAAAPRCWLASRAGEAGETGKVMFHSDDCEWPGGYRVA